MRFFKGYKDIIQLALPISLSIAIPQINFLTNTAFLGRLGERELGVNGIAGIYYLILSMVGYGLCSGIQIQLARRAGEKDTESLAKTFSNGLLLAIFFSLSLMMVSMWLTPLIYGFALNDAENTRYSIHFIFVRVWGLPFFILTQLFNSFFIAIQKSKFLIYGSLAATFITILFDYLLIFGMHGFPQWGLQGSAIASILGEFAGLLTMIMLFIIHKYPVKFPVKKYFGLDMALTKKSLKVASPLIVQFLFSIGGWQVFFIFVEHLGNKELAASQILRSIFGILSIGTWALATACNTMVSFTIGENKTYQVIPIIKKVSKLSFMYAVTLSLLLLIFADGFLSIYRDDSSLIALAKPSLQVIVVAMIIMSLATIVFNGVVGTGNTMVNLMIEISCVSAYLVYCFVVIEHLRLPLHWAWGSEFVYWGSLLLIATLYLYSGKWKGKQV